MLNQTQLENEKNVMPNLGFDNHSYQKQLMNGGKMDKRYSRIIENSKGEGEIYEDSIFVDTVYYRFQVSQEFILSETYDGSQSIPGIKRLSGAIKLQNIKLDILGKYFKLELSDKKTWNILISSGDFIKGEYEFVLGPGN